MSRHRACVWGIVIVGIVLFSGCAAAPDIHKTACASAKCACHCSASCVLEPARHVPVAYDVDVVVAGGGISGVFAALAAAREGARTVIIDRFGTVGGAFGPGMNSQEGALRDHSGELFRGVPNDSVKGGVVGLPKEFADIYFALQPEAPARFLADTNKSSYVAMKMLREAGVTMMLSAYVADPIMEGNRVCGVFVENKSGRQAVRARIVIDATGEADVARRAGVPILLPSNTWDFDHHSPTGMGIWAMVAGLDRGKFDSKKADELGKEKVDLGGVAEISCGGLEDVGPDPNMLAIKAQLVRPSLKVDAGNAEHISILEAGARMYIFDYVQRCRAEVQGLENAYVLFIAPFFGARGGPCIDGEYTLTVHDLRAGKFFDDVIYVYGEPRALRWTNEHGGIKWADVPYRVMIPKKIDGLIAVGRSASGMPDTLLRNREGVMYMGQAGGTAAAMAVKSGIEPRKLDVKQLQRKLLDAGFYLGDDARLAELGLK